MSVDDGSLGRKKKKKKTLSVDDGSLGRQTKKKKKKRSCPRSCPSRSRNPGLGLVSAALSDPESDNHQKNQPKNHCWICSVATETRLKISVSWSSRTTRRISHQDLGSRFRIPTVQAGSHFRNPTVWANSANPLKHETIPSDGRTHML